MIKSQLCLPAPVFLCSRLIGSDHRGKCFFLLLFLMYFFLNPCESPFHLRSVLLHPLWMEEGHLYPRHVDFSSCSPAESHFSGAAVEEVWRRPPAHSFNSAVVKTKIQKKKKEHMRSERSCWPLLLPSRGLITRRSRPAALLSCVSLQPWIKAQTLSTTLHSLWPSFAVYSSIFEACLKHVLFLWYWPYGANVYVQYLATVVHPCGGPRAWWGSPRCRF